MTWQTGLLGLVAGLLIATVTAPVGVSGAVFLLPVQFSLLGVPSPAVTPTNLLFNVIAGPGALLRYRRQGGGTGPLARRLVLGTLPGVVIGALIRVFIVPGPSVFRLVVAAVLLPVGLWLVAATLRKEREPAPGEPAGRAITAMALCVGIVGGIYGIGGGSILGPILVSRGMPVTKVAPAALVSTFVTSIAGSVTYAILGLARAGPIAPDWPLGLLCGLGGQAGGYLGAALAPRLPEAVLRLLLGGLAMALGVLYVVQAVR